VRRANIPVGRDKMPEVMVLPRPPLDLVRRLVAGSADEAAGSVGAAPPITPARLLTPELRAALRVLAPVLLRGNGSGYQARLPYDIEMR
jgi:hypothetical protein